MFLAIVIAIVSLFVYYEYFYDKRTRDLAARIPGPAGWPVIGNADIFFCTNKVFSEVLWEYCQKFGNRCRFLLGHKLIVIVSDPKDIEQVASKILNKAEQYRLAENWMGGGLLVNDGPTAHWKRKTVFLPAYVTNLNSHTAVIAKATDSLIKKLEPLAGGPQIDMTKYIALYGHAIITETTTGIQANTFEKDETEYSKSVDILTKCLDDKFSSLIYQSKFIHSLTESGKNERKALDIVTKECLKIIKERQKMHERPDHGFDNPSKASFLDMLLMARNEKGETMSIEDMVGDIQVLLMAGQDTQASTNKFMLYELSRHPEIQRKLYEEQVEIFGKDRNKDPEIEDLSNMEYLNMTIKEILRLYNVVPSIGRQTDEEIDINGMLLPKGCNVFIDIRNMNRNEKNFPEPSKFDPERFTAEEIKKRPVNASIPFSSGPRNCIGLKFAMRNIKFLFSKLIRSFEFLPGDQEMNLQYTLITKSTNGAFIRLVKRT